MGAPPEPGDRILVLKKDWLEKILDGVKTLELRHMRLKAGRCFLGSKSKIYGEAFLGEAELVPTMVEFRARYSGHRVDADSLPYKKTWAIPLLKVRKTQQQWSYVHPTGAVGIVKFR